jgi:YihY family inner membrane protein
MIVIGPIRSLRGAPLSKPRGLGEETRRLWEILCLATNKFFRIDGAQWAGAFAFNAFFSLFPLVILSVTIASAFIDRDRAGQEIIAYMESYIPITGEMQRHIFQTISGVIKARRQAGAVALLIMVWVALQSFTTLICATNRAWGIAEYKWWRLPLKSLIFLTVTVCMVLLGIGVPVLVTIAKDWFFPVNDLSSWVYAMVSFFIPLLVVFISLSLFYSLAPRRPTRFAEVWAVALGATVLLQLAESLFVIYLKKFATLNAVYGAFGGIMALMLWIYLSGCIFIFGACLCAAQAAGHSAPEETIITN